MRFVSVCAITSFFIHSLLLIAEILSRPAVGRSAARAIAHVFEIMVSVCVPSKVGFLYGRSLYFLKDLYTLSIVTVPISTNSIRPRNLNNARIQSE